MSQDKLVKGIFVKDPSENAPKYVIANLGFKVEDLKAWLDETSKEIENYKGFVNANLLRSKEGKLYMKVNEWSKKEDVKEEVEPVKDVKEDYIEKGQSLSEISRSIRG